MVSVAKNETVIFMTSAAVKFPIESALIVYRMVEARTA